MYQHLLHLLATEPISRNGSTIYSTQANIGKAINCATPEVCKAIKELTSVGIILEHKRGLITINPRCAWNGKRNLWQKACMQLEDTHET